MRSKAHLSAELQITTKR